MPPIPKPYCEVIRLSGVPRLGFFRGLILTRKLGRGYGWFGVKNQEPLFLYLVEGQSRLRHDNFSGP